MVDLYLWVMWVDMDDLNDGLNCCGNEIKNDFYYLVEGYKVFGEWFVGVVCELIVENE